MYIEGEICYSCNKNKRETLIYGLCQDCNLLKKTYYKLFKKLIGSNKYERRKFYIRRYGVKGAIDYIKIVSKIKYNYCYCCGFKYFLQVHHIDGNKMNNNLTNLVKLCKNCHDLIHLKKIKINDLKVNIKSFYNTNMSSFINKRFI